MTFIVKMARHGFSQSFLKATPLTVRAMTKFTTMGLYIFFVNIPRITRVMARCDFVDVALEHPSGAGADTRHFFHARSRGFQIGVGNSLLLSLK